MGTGVRIALLVGAIGLVLPALGAEAPPWAPYHPWGSFSPGVWKTVRVVTESLDEHGRPTSISTTETTTTLTARDAQGITLLVEAVVELVDKRLTVLPRSVRQDYFGLSAGHPLQVKFVGKTQLELEGQRLPVQVHQAEETTPNGRTVTKIYFSDRVPPYVLRRETRCMDTAGNLLAETISSVVAVGLPWKVLSEIHQTALLHTFHKDSKGTVETWAIISAEVPGGVVSQASKEYDQSGRLVRRSNLELVDYGLQPSGEPKRGLFPRLRAKRAQRM
ncbi:MAG: hypothetical protein NZ602_09660 [Thermoguttaceae bacterium]|nr:hypothetical protein [Thermoguttaceae bacterium]MDW8038759.1 hypothetical protein [Thermoguttaceae bacterium]